jgi:glyoxylase-like metal-dependent hydrolase (beta-lactamase superfamily II)
LNAAGYTANDIDTVVLSHYHGDHILGVKNKAGELVYPKAKIMVPSVEHNFWMDDARMAAAPEGMKGAYQTVRRMLGGLGNDRLIQFEAGVEIVPGIKSVAAYGHTPGHTLFMVESKGEKFAYLADITNVPQLFARNPDWAVQFDMNAEEARLARRKVFDMIVSERVMAGGFHFPFPAFGRVEKLGNGFEFKPVA